MVYPNIPDFNKYIVGVSYVEGNPYSFQFIFNDKSRTHADDAQIRPKEWKDVLIPKNNMISCVKLCYDKIDAVLYGVRFESAWGLTLLTAGKIDDAEFMKQPGIEVKTIQIQKG